MFCQVCHLKSILSGPSSVKRLIRVSALDSLIAFVCYCPSGLALNGLFVTFVRVFEYSKVIRLFVINDEILQTNN